MPREWSALSRNSKSSGSLYPCLRRRCFCRSEVRGSDVRIPGVRAMTLFNFPLKPASPGRSPVVQHLFSTLTLKLAAVHDFDDPHAFKVWQPGQHCVMATFMRHSEWLRAISSLERLPWHRKRTVQTPRTSFETVRCHV